MEIYVKKEVLKNNLLRGGPGDKTKPGEYDTSAWFAKLSPTGKNKEKDPNSILNLTKNKKIWFCSIPFTQVYSEINGNYKACCFGADSGVKVEDVSLREWMEESEYMNSIREEMLDPNSNFEAVNKICKRCVDDEKRYGRSRRTNCMKMHTNDWEHWDGIEKSADMFKASGIFDFEDRVFEIQLKVFGSECNLDCHMCIHANSSMRMDMAKKGVWDEKIWGSLDRKKAIYENVSKDRTKGIVEQVVELAPYIRSIKIIGGEPLIMKKQYELLDALVETGDSKDIRIKYQTNFTTMVAGKHNFFNYVPHFKNIAMVGSVDGIGKSIEYMRRRTNWNELENNIDMCNKYPNIDVDFNGLVSFLSVLRFYEVIDYCKGNDKIHQINWAMIERPKHLRVNNLPDKIKENLLPKYKDWPDIQAALSKDPEPDISIQDTFNYLLKQDKAYIGTKWEMHLFDVFPELKEYYE